MTVLCSAYLVSSKCLGHKAPMTTNLSKALKAFQQRQARYLPSGARRGCLCPAGCSRMGLGVW